MKTTLSQTTDSDNTRIALINNNISYIQKDISDIKSSVKELSGVYVTKLEADDKFKAIEAKLLLFDRRRGLWQWLGPTLSAAVALILEFLFTSYLQHLK